MIEKIPGGRPRKVWAPSPKREPKVIEQARAVVARERAELPAAPAIPWQEQRHPEKLNTLTGKALDKTWEILDLPCDPDNLKLLSIQKDAALSVLSTQTKVDENRLRQHENRDRAIAELLREIEEERAREAKASPKP